MKKLLTIAGLMLMSTRIYSAQIHYLQDVQNDGKVKFGVNASSAGARDAELIFKNATNDNTVTLKSTDTTTSYQLTFPKSAGANGEALATDTNGQLYWTAVSTLTSADAVSQSLSAIANSSHTGIAAAYTAPNTLNLSLSTSVVMDGQNANLNVVNVSSMTSAGSITAGSIVNQGSLNTGSVTSTGTITTEENIAINRDKKIILNKDQDSSSYISQQSGDNSLEFFKNGVLYMRLED